MIDASGPDTETFSEHLLPNYQPATERDHLKDRSESELKLIRKKLQEGWFSKITPEQEAAMNDYVTDSSINAELRIEGGIKRLTESETQQFLAIEDAIELAGRRDAATKMWRGIAPEFKNLRLAQLELSLKTGKHFRELGIQSYSIQPGTAAFIANDGGLVLELESRRGIYVSEIARSTEEEVLQSSDAVFVVHKLLRDVIVETANGERLKGTLARLKEPGYGST